MTPTTPLTHPSILQGIVLNYRASVGMLPEADKTANSVSEKIVQKNIVEKDELMQRGLNHLFMLLPQ